MAVTLRLGTARPWALGALLVLFLAAEVRADFREPYRLGLEAIERQDWVEAVRQMDRAIAQRPESSGLLGAPLFRRYTPHFYRGYALALLGDCRAALASLDEAERQGKVGRDELAQMEQARRTCRARISTVEQAMDLAREEIDRAASAAAAVALIESNPLMAREWRSGDPSFASRQEQALGQLAEARNRLAEADRRLDLDLANEAGTLGQHALKSLESLHEEAGARRNELRAGVDRLLTEIRQLAEAAQRDLRFVASYLEPFPPALAEIRNRLEGTLEVAQRASGGSHPDDLRELQGRLQRELQQLRRAVQLPPAQLQEAVTAFLAADYTAALELLGEDNTFRDRRARAHACLLRAGAHHALHRMGGAEDSELLDAARRDLLDCKKEEIQVAPHPRAFSPAFLAFYQRELLAGPPAPEARQ